MLAARAKGVVEVGVAERALKISGGGGARFFEADLEIATGDVIDEDDRVGCVGSVGVGGSRLTFSARLASSSSVILAVRSGLSSGTNNVSRGREGAACWLVLSSVVSPPTPFKLSAVELSTASSDEMPGSPLTPSSAFSLSSTAAGVSTSTSSYSSSSKGSTSASRSATNRQFGHRKFGQLGPWMRFRTHL